MNRDGSRARPGWRKRSPVAAPVVAGDDPRGFGFRGRERRRLLFRVSLLGALAICLVAILLAVLRRNPDRKVPLIVAAVTASGAWVDEDPLPPPPNAFAAEDLRRMRDWFAGGRDDPAQHLLLHGRVLRPEALADRTGTLGLDRGGPDRGGLVRGVVDDVLASRPGGPGGDMIVVYVSAVGVVAENRPYLLTGESLAHDPETWLPVDSLFSALGDALDRGQGEISRARVLLMLDGSRGQIPWDWGTLGETFASCCGREFARSDHPRMALLVSCDDGQRSWWDPRTGHSLFAESIREGLTGRGDQGDGVLTVGEFVSYVTRRVPQQSRAVWGLTQRPQFFAPATAETWPLITVPDDAPGPAPGEVDVAKLAAALDRVERFWERHNELARRTVPPLAFDPIAWSLLEKRLARLTQITLSGRGYEDEFARLATACESMLSGLAQGPPQVPDPRSLPEVALSAWLRPESDSEAAARLAEAWEREPDPAKVRLPEAAGEDPEWLAARLLWPWIRRQGYTPAAVRSAAGFLEAQGIPHGGSPGARGSARESRGAAAKRLETHWIRLLSADDLPPLSAAQLGAILTAHDASREAAFPSDLRAAMRAAEWTRQPDRRRMRLTDQVLAADRGDTAAEGLRRLVGEEWAAIRRRGEIWSASYRLADQMLHETPRIAETLLSQPEAFWEDEPGAADAGLVRRSTDRLVALLGTLRQPSGDDPDGQAETLSTRRRDAADAAETLRQRLRLRVASAAESKASDERGLRQTVALLAGTGVTDVDDRRRLHRRFLELVGRPKNVWTENVAAAAPRTDPSPRTDPAPRTDPRPADPGPVSAGSLFAGSSAGVSDGGPHPWSAWVDAIRGTFADLGTEPDPLREIFPGAGESSGAGAPPPAAVAGPDAASADDDEIAVTSRSPLPPVIACLRADGGRERAAWQELFGRPAARVRRGDRAAEIRRPVEELDRRLRGLSCLVTHEPAAAGRLVRGRFALDSRLLMLTHARRVLDEFWCEARPGERPYFAAAAGQLTDAMATSPAWGRIDPILDGVDLRDRRRAAVEAADDPATLQARTADSTGEAALYRFVAGTSVPFVLSRPDAVPDGVIAVTSPGGDRAVVASPADVPPGGGPLAVALQVPGGQPATFDRFAVRTFFRGLRREGGMALAHLQNPRTVPFDLPAYGAPQAIVLRDRPDPLPVVLVLDYSGSMKGDPLREARSAVEGFIDGLKGSGEVSVGLVLFGHEYGWKTQPGSNRLLYEDGRGTVIRIRDGVAGDVRRLRLDEQAGNNPNFFVEELAPLAPLDEAHARRIVDQVRRAEAAGVTPTYQALIRAYEMLRDHPSVVRGGPGLVLLMTDGKPELAGDTQVEGVRLARDRFRRDAIRRYGEMREQVRLTIVDYEAGSGGVLNQDFPGVDVQSAATGDALSRVLRAAVPRPQAVWKRDGMAVSPAFDFDRWTAIEPWPPAGVSSAAGRPIRPAIPLAIEVGPLAGGTGESDSPNPFRRDAADLRGGRAVAAVAAEGGESFRLRLRDGTLSHEPFSDEHRVVIPLEVDGPGSDRFAVMALPASRNSRGQLELPLAIEARRQGRFVGEFTPRPQDVWIELLGFESGSSGNAGRSVRYDLTWPEYQTRPPQPVPVLRCRAHDWPAWAKRVQVTARLRFDGQPPPRWPLPLDREGDFTIEQVSGVVFRTTRSRTAGGGLRWEVTERYQDRDQVGKLRVLTDPLPDAARCLTYPSQRCVVRVFEFDSPPGQWSAEVSHASAVAAAADVVARGTLDVASDSR